MISNKEAQKFDINSIDQSIFQDLSEKESEQINGGGRRRRFATARFFTDEQVGGEPVENEKQWL